MGTADLFEEAAAYTQENGSSAMATLVCIDMRRPIRDKFADLFEPWRGYQEYPGPMVEWRMTALCLAAAMVRQGGL